jgi:uncharacterized membrane protein
MRSKLAIAGHPIHPMLVSIPIGLFAWAFVGDIIYVARDHDRMWYDIAFWTGIAAWITALVAALPGLGDYLLTAIHTDARAVATAHMVLNVAVVALYFIAMLLMLDHNATAGGQLGTVFVLHLVGVGLLLLSGWLGGEMVYRSHLGMVPDDSELERAENQHHESLRLHGSHR